MNGLSRSGWRRVEAILDGALDLGGAERAAFVGEVCDGDRGLRAEVEAFLAADECHHRLLDTSLGDLAIPLLRELAGTTSRVPLPELAAGTLLGQYELVSRVGVGGMGEVYRAKDRTLGREVAVKVLRAAAADAERLRRFEQEARSASALNHPNIVTIHGIGEDRGTRYIVMEHVEGRTLRELLTAGPIPARELLRLASQMASGLAKAHAAGIVHRDLKPENVMVSTDGFAKIVDFGLTKLVSPLPRGRSRALATATNGTRPFLGTVGYMSPEQVKGQGVDFRSDQFSLGAILHELATGRKAFQGETVRETLAAILDRDPEPPLAPDLPARFRSLVERCLAKTPDERFDSTKDLARELLYLHEQSLRFPGRRARARPSSAGGSREEGAAMAPLAGGRSIPPDAYECYLLGRFLLNQRTTAALGKSVEHFERALEGAPDYAPAHSGLADALVLLAGAGHGASADDLVERARQAATRALELDGTLAAAHTSLAFLRFKFDWDWPGAEAAFLRALELGPGDPSAHHWYALFLSALGRHEEAKAHIHEAQRLDPLSLIIRVAASRVLQFGRDFDGAIEHSRKALELDPGYAEAHFNLGMCWFHKSMYREAIEELERAVALSGERPLFLAVLGHALARSGRAGEARRILDRLRDLSKVHRVSPVALSILHVGLGETDETFAALERGIDERDGMVVFLNADPFPDSVRTDPRFARCLRRLGLAPRGFSGLSPLPGPPR